MKVLLINGSPRIAGNSSILLNEMIESISILIKFWSNFIGVCNLEKIDKPINIVLILNELLNKLYTPIVIIEIKVGQR